MKQLKLVACVTALAFLGLAAIAPAQGKNNHHAEMLLQEAQHKALVEGDLEQAIELCKQIVAGVKGNRTVVAKALVQMGQCYEKLGRAEARKTYQRVVQEYADQSDEVAEARIHLFAIDQDNVKPEVTVRKVFDHWGVPSPDGRLLSFCNWEFGDLAIHDLITGESHDITDGGKSWDNRVYFAGETPAWSSDGKQIAYAWLSYNPDDFPHELRIVGLDGSEPRVLYRNENEDVLSINVHDWSHDGKFILAGFKKKTAWRPNWDIVLVSVADGSVRTLTSIKTTSGRPSWQISRNLSLNGRYAVYDQSVKEQEGLRDIFLVTTDGEEIPFIEHPADDWGPLWAPDGKSIVFQSDRSGTNGIWLINVVDGKPLGEAQLVRANTGPVLPLGFTPEGSYYYATLRPTIGWNASPRIGDVYVASIDPKSGKPMVPPTKFIKTFEGFNGIPTWSPDGKNLAYVSGRPSARSARLRGALIVLSLETGQESEFYPDVRVLTHQHLKWSPNGDSILCGRNLQLFDIQTGEVSDLADQKTLGNISDAAWSPDGTKIFYLKRIKGWDWIYVHDLETGEEKEFHPERVGTRPGLAVSPDGSKIAFGGDESLMVMPTQGGKPREFCRLKDIGKYHFTIGSGFEWTADGRYVLVRLQHDSEMSPLVELWRIPLEGGKAQKVIDGVNRLLDVSVHPDGRRIAYTATGTLEDRTWAIENFLPKPPASQ